MKFNILDHLPPGLLETPATELYKILPGPTLIHLKGKKKDPLFLSCLVHGNETTGLLAVQALLKKYSNSELPRSISLFFGNVLAAKEGRRHLDHQPDFNRIWKMGDSDENKIAQRVLDEMRSREVFASVDIHNNTGRNPHYACMTRLDDKTLNMVRLFSKIGLYFPTVTGTLTDAFSELCPAVTLESGQPGLVAGTLHAMEYADMILNLDSIPENSSWHKDLQVMDIAATIKVPTEASVGLGDEESDICFVDDFDLFNFTEVKPGTLWGRINKKSDISNSLEISRCHGTDTEDLFSYADGEIRNQVPIIPAMITLDRRILKSDCVGYIMRRMNTVE